MKVVYDKILGELREDDSPTFGIADTNAVKVDDADATAGQWVKFTTNGVEGTAAPIVSETDPVVGAITGIVKANGAGTISAASAGTDYQAPLTFGIADTNAVKIDSSTVADDEYARFTASGLESRSVAEVVTDLGVPTAPEILVIKQLTAAQYAALTPKIDTTLYIIVG
jgi:hypothetical protein